MNKLRVKPLFAAITMAIAASPSFAQETVEVEEVLVTGFRASLENSLNAKKNATGVVDAIYAEDIADFPDNNLAESLQRIPGVAISRVGGEGRQITVRGLGPQFTRVQVNGMEAMSSTGSTDAAGGNNRSRSFDFNTFSSDLFTNLLVRKTNSAEIAEGSIGATVELRTARPSDFDEFTFSVSAQAGYNDLSEETDPKLSFLVANQFSDTFGALFSLSYSSRNITDEGSSTVRWSQGSKNEEFGFVNGNPCLSDTVTPTDDCRLINGSDDNRKESGVFHPRIPRYDSYTHEIDRTGAAVAFQLTPTDTIDVGLDILYSNHDATRREVFMQGVGNNSGFMAPYNLTDWVIEGNTLVYAQIEDAALQSENRFDELETQFTQATLSYDHELSDRLRLKVLAGMAKSEFDNPVQNTIIMRATGQQFTWDYRGDGADTMLKFGEDAYQKDSWSLVGVRQRPQSTNNEFTNFSADLEFDINENLTIKGGISAKNYDFDSSQNRLGSEGDNGQTLNDSEIVTYDSGLGDGRPWLIPDQAAFSARTGVFSNQGIWELKPRERDIFSIKEETTSAYVQLNFNTELGETPVSGDIGFRFFSTDQSSTGWFDTNEDNVNEQVWVDHSYDDILPSMNLKFEPLEDVVFRFSMSEGIARAGLSSLKADQSVGVSGSSFSITGGNPKLEPTKATSYDTGVELYFSDNSAMSLTIFKKEINSHAQSLKDQQTPASLGIPQPVVEEACSGAEVGYGDQCNENLLWNRSVALNGPGGDLHGFEWQYQGTFGFLGDFGEYFGYITNYTYVKTQVTYLDKDGNVDIIADLRNLSDVTKSATFYFENDSFSARIAIAERSDYLTDPRGRDGNEQHGTYGTSNVDFSASYTLNDNLKFTFEALNLTNEADDQWVDINDRRLSYYHETGTQFYLGAQYKF